MKKKLSVKERIAKKKWFKEAIEKKAPYDLGEWSKNSPAIIREKQALDSRPKNWSLHKKYLSAARALQSLSNVTTDEATKERAKHDADYFFEKAKKANKNRKVTKKNLGGGIENDVQINVTREGDKVKYFYRVSHQA